MEELARSMQLMTSAIAECEAKSLHLTETDGQPCPDSARIDVLPPARRYTPCHHRIDHWGD